MKVSDYIAEFLYKKGVTVVFEMIGGMTAHMIDSIHKARNIKIVSLHHEQAAGFAAEGYARTKGTPGVALATSGPGATNLITAIGSCFFDSVPTLFITGQVNTNEQKQEGTHIRQLGFQETDIVSIVKPITKLARKINDETEIETALEEAFALCLEGRPGPVLLDIAMNIQRAEIQPAYDSPVDKTKGQWSFSVLNELQNAIKNAKRPLILAGGGIRSSGADNEFRSFVESIKIPVVHSLMGWDAYIGGDLRIGMIGSYGNRWANIALSECDLLLVLGSRLDVRQTGAQIEEFVKGKEIYHVDCISDEMNNRIKGCHEIRSSLQYFFAHISENDGFNSVQFNDENGWLKQLAQWKNKYPDIEEVGDIKGVNPNTFLKQLSIKVPDMWSFVTDVGQHQMWAAQSIEPKIGHRFITSGGMGAMGFGLPAAIGVNFGSQQPVVLVAGDGGFQCNIQELEAISHHSIPIKMIVMNNLSLGMVRQFQESYFEDRYQGTVWGYSAPSFIAVAKAYNIDGLRIVNPEDISNAIDWLMRDDRPCLLEVSIDTHTPVNPKLMFGQPLSKMSPERP